MCTKSNRRIVKCIIICFIEIYQWAMSLIWFFNFILWPFLFILRPQVGAEIRSAYAHFNLCAIGRKRERTHWVLQAYFVQLLIAIIHSVLLWSRVRSSPALRASTIIIWCNKMKRMRDEVKRTWIYVNSFLFGLIAHCFGTLFFPAIPFFLSPVFSLASSIMYYTCCHQIL